MSDLRQRMDEFKTSIILNDTDKIRKLEAEVKELEDDRQWLIESLNGIEVLIQVDASNQAILDFITKTKLRTV